jgi:hypothetical protein
MSDLVPSLNLCLLQIFAAKVFAKFRQISIHAAAG